MVISIESISREAKQFIQLCQQSTSLISTADKVDQLAQRHRDHKNQFLDFLKHHTELMRSLSDADDSSVLQTTAISDEAENVWHQFEDALVTRFPQAPIEYGQLLIGAAISSADLPIAPELKNMFPYLQNVRGDGNCFYTSFSLSYLSWLCQDPHRIEPLIPRILEMPAFPGKDETVRLLLNLQATPSSLESCVRSDSNLLVFISFLRNCAAYQMTVHNRDWMDSYSPESDQDPATPDEYITDHVLKMGCDAQAYEISAITQFFDCQLWVVDHEHGLTRINETKGDIVGAVFRSDGHYSYLQPQFHIGHHPHSIAKTATKIALPIMLGVTALILGYLRYGR